MKYLVGECSKAVFVLKFCNLQSKHEGKLLTFKNIKRGEKRKNKTDYKEFFSRYTMFISIKQTHTPKKKI